MPFGFVHHSYSKHEGQLQKNETGFPLHAVVTSARNMLFKSFNDLPQLLSYCLFHSLASYIETSTPPILILSDPTVYGLVWIIIIF